MKIRNYLYIGMMLSMLMVVSCTDEAEQEDGDTLNLLSYTPELREVTATRAAIVPTGYIPYLTMHPEAVAEHHAIGVYLTVPAKNNRARYRRFVYMTDHWQSYAVVQENVEYYIYGFMPMSGAEETSITPYQDDYSRGAELTLRGVNSLSHTDVCVLVGVKGVENVTDDIEVSPGSFYYMGKGRDKNNVYMLFNHLYSAIQFSIRIGDGYAGLRRVRLKSMKLKSTNSEKVDVQVSLRPGDTPVSEVSFPTRGATGCEVVLLDTETDLTTSYVPIGDLCYFFSSSAQNMTLESVYDVYDRYGNLVRENCKSVNTLDFLSLLVAGDKRNVKLTVDPTYIYQLSEDDVDSPFLVQ